MEKKKFGFGWMRLPITDPYRKESIDVELAAKMADLFLSRGFTYFDTGYMYHNYNAENALRQAVVERHPRESFTIADKMPMTDIQVEQEQEMIFSIQKKRCGVSSFDYYLLHNLNASNYGKANELHSFDFLKRKLDSGEIREVGFSFHDTAQTLDRILTEHPEFSFVQLQLNYLDWENEGVQSRKCWETARAHGKEIVVMEPVKGGTLANIPAEAEQILRRVHPEWSPSSWALRFAAGLPGVRMVLSGMSSMEQVDQNTQMMQQTAPLTQEETDTLMQAGDVIKGSVTVPCTGCRYCVEGDRCPQNIAIPSYFALYNQEMLDTNPSWSSEKELYNNLLAQGFGSMDSCLKCGNCEEACPQHLPIRRYLEEASDFFDCEGSGRYVTGERRMKSDGEGGPQAKFQNHCG